VTIAVVIGIVGTATMPVLAKASKKSDRRIAKVSTLKLSDLSGSGWTAQGAESVDLSQVSDEAPTACAPFKTLGPINAEAATGFVNDDGAQVFNAVALYRSVKPAKAYFAALRSPTAAECLEFALGGAPAFQSADVNIGSADDGVGFETQYESSTGAVIYLQVVIYRVGRATITFLTQNYGAVYPDTDKLVLSAVARLRENLK